MQSPPGRRRLVLRLAAVFAATGLAPCRLLAGDNIWTAACSGGGPIVIPQSSPETAFAVFAELSDNGQQCRRLSMPALAPPPPFQTVTTIAVDATDLNTIYTVVVGPGGGGPFFKSADGGTTWQVMDSPNPDGTGWAGEQLVGHPATHNTLYNFGDGVLRSRDGGASWTHLGVTLVVNAMVIGPRPPFSLYVASADGQVIRSDDDGENWAQIANGQIATSNVLSIAVDSSTGDTVVVGTSDNGIFRTTDGGVTWVQANSGLTTQDSTLQVEAVAVDPYESSVFYAGVQSSGFFISTDSGGTWTPLNAGLPSVASNNPNAITVSVVSPRVIYLAGVYVLTLSGCPPGTDSGCRLPPETPSRAPRLTRVAERPVGPRSESDLPRR
jgi:photosystem II stability/assembly factor-like uncharacterized protein